MMTPRPINVHTLAVSILLSILIHTGSAQDTTIITTISTSTVILGTSTITVLPGDTKTYITGDIRVSTAISSPTPMAPSWSGSGFQDATLNSTNYYRESYQAQPLSWNSSLASFARNHAQKCVWEHSGGPYGENLAENFRTPDSAIDAWAGEEENYDYEDAEFGEDTGHFTQLVWQTTQTIGCAAVNCNNDDDDGANGYFLVCEYYPAGNIVGNFAQNVRKPGQDAEGRPGIGAAPRLGGSGRLLVALVALSSLAAVCL